MAFLAVLAARCIVVGCRRMVVARRIWLDTLVRRVVGLAVDHVAAVMVRGCAEDRVAG